MLNRLVLTSIQMRKAIVGLLVLLLLAGVWAMRTLPIDAMPDVSTIQVSVLTTASGLTPVEIERAVTTPIENALNGVPGSVELRSTSRAGLSAVTVVFDESIDVWFARQLVLERLRSVEAELPPSASTPELAPVSSGLGEIYQFVVRSDHHSPMQLRTLLDWEIVPKIRSVPGVVEVNTMGGELKQFQVVVDRARLQAQRLSLQDVIGALESANMNVGGGYMMMLLGANSRTVVHDVGVGVAQIQKDLPAGVTIDVIYDRSDFVGRTISTVLWNLIEGVLIVTLVLTLLLGSLRGALAVVLGIPASMSDALLGMRRFHVTGDLMSLGAIDFGFLVEFFPAVLVLAVPPQQGHGPRWVEWIAAKYGRIVPSVVARRWLYIAGSALVLLASGAAFASAGAELSPWAPRSRRGRCSPRCAAARSLACARSCGASPRTSPPRRMPSSGSSAWCPREQRRAAIWSRPGRGSRRRRGANRPPGQPRSSSAATAWASSGMVR